MRSVFLVIFIGLPIKLFNCIINGGDGDDDDDDDDIYYSLAELN
jgi:hypothetical protein